MPQGRAQFWLLFTAVFMLALVFHARSWNFGLTFLDDRDIIVTRAALLAKSSSFVDSFTNRYFLSSENLYYRPLVNLSFALDAHLGGSRPWVYHFTNGLLHAGACVLLLVSMLRMGIQPSCAFAACLLFAVHPMHVASVAWIPGRNDLLLGCFTLGALSFLALGGTTYNRLGHGLCFAGALLCKETAVCLPIGFVAYVLARDGWTKLVHAKGLWLAWALTLGVYFRLRAHFITMPAGFTSNAVKSALQHLGMFVSDLGKLVFPIHLQVIATAKDIDAPLGFVALVAISLTLLGLHRWLRMPVVVLGCALVVLPLGMALLASDFIALESRLYLPIAGVSLLAAECLHALRTHRLRLWAATLTAAAGVGIVFASATIRYSEQFSDRFRFAEAAIKASPRSYLAIWLNAQRSMQAPTGPSRTTTPGPADPKY